MRIPELIKKARGELNQTEFAATLGKTQGELSKYESGRTQAPNSVIERCLDILEMNTADISADALAAKIIENASAEEHSSLRSAISQMLNAAASKQK